MATEAAGAAPEAALSDDKRRDILLLLLLLVLVLVLLVLLLLLLLLPRNRVRKIICRLAAAVVAADSATDRENAGVTKALQEHWLRWVVATTAAAVAETTSKRLQLPI